jgi:hypothetical protein
LGNAGPDNNVSQPNESANDGSDKDKGSWRRLQVHDYMDIFLLNIFSTLMGAKGLILFVAKLTGEKILDFSLETPELMFKMTKRADANDKVTICDLIVTIRDKANMSNKNFIFFFEHHSYVKKLLSFRFFKSYSINIQCIDGRLS